MKKLYFLTVAAFFLLLSLVQAQQPQYLPCGTPPVKSEWLKAYQRHPHHYRTGSDTMLYIPLTIHFVGNDDGTSYTSPMKVLEAICALNEDYAGSNANMFFYIEGDFKYIDSTAWNNHSAIVDGYNMMMANNVPNTINSYMVSNPAGNAGYNLPSASAIAMSKNYVNASASTWAHEIGHNLSVQHPFLGWEGKTYSYNTPTPVKVTYDYTSFKTTFHNGADTTIIDTAWVELVDGSNCSFAADGFCDTPPDYLTSGGWACNANGESVQLLKDPNSVDFRADATNIMSYANDACAEGFSNEQITAMRANLLTQKASYLYNNNPMRDTINGLIAPNYPANGDFVNHMAVDFNWNSVAGATHYVFQVSFVASFSVMTAEFVTSDTTANITDLINNRKYYWRVKPFNNGYTCAAVSPRYEFTTSDLSPVKTVNSIQQFKAFPTIITSGQAIQMNFMLDKPLEAQAMLFGMNGQLMQQKQLTLQAGFNQHQLETPTLAAGMYVLAVQTVEGVVREKILVVE